MKKLILLSLLLFSLSAVYAQTGGGIKGNVISRVDKAWIDGAKITLNTPLPQKTESRIKGVFEFKNVPDGVWELTVEATEFLTMRVTVKVSGAVREIVVSLTPEVAGQMIDESSFAEFDTESGNDSYESMPVTLTASKDVFDNIASYNFSKMRFRTRGYELSTTDIYFNGILMNDAETGYSPWSLWGGLNDVTRNQENTRGLMVSDYGLGMVNGTTAINATASHLRPGLRTSLVAANATYRFRAMVTYASGENDKGWSYALSASTRQGSGDWVKGVFYDTWSYYGSVEKRINNCNRIALTVLGAPTQRGVQGASTQEVYDLVGSNYYNPNWGYQGGNETVDGRYIDGGEMRNARVRNTHEPIAILNYTYNINPKNTILATASYRFGFNGYSALDWYTGADPRPDYYRNLPSEYADDPSKAAYYTEGWLSDWNIRQFNWNAMYNRNYESFFDSETVTNPAVNNYTRRSIYVVEERHIDQRDANAKVQLVSMMSEKFKLSAGLEYRWNRSEYYKKMKDLLGGDYWLDIDKFAERDFTEGGDAIQNNLNDPNRLIKKGDKYGYDYFGHVRSGKAWGILRYTGSKIESYLALEAGNVQMWREGLYRKGLFPNDSYGNSDKKSFFTYAAKGGATYKITGKHLISVNLAYINEAPFFDRSFVSPRTRNELLPGLTTQKFLSGDLNYSMRINNITLRVTGYYTSIKDQVDIISYYNDLNGTFSNLAMSNIDQMNTGVEIGLQIPITRALTFKGGLSYGYFIYTSNPLVTETADNTATVLLNNEPVFWKNYKVDGTPQTAASIGLDYRSSKNLFLGVNAGYYNANYISMNPKRRTDLAIQNLTPEQAANMSHQEMYPEAFLLNASVGKFWYIKSYMIGFNLNVDNILNNKNIKTGGYEQMRLNKTSASADPLTTYAPFDSKYFYLFGTTYYLNAYFRF